MSGPALGEPVGWAGGVLGPGTVCVLAPNPGLMTLDGTNTWVLSGEGTAVVIDPGPLDEGHLARCREAVEDAGARITQVWLTHGHSDHSEGAARFAELAGGVPVRALDPAHRLGEEGLAAGDRCMLGDRELVVVGTPGHTHDSLSFVLDDGHQRDLLTGDTVLGRGTTVVAHPDGALGPYLDSLRRLRDLAEVAQACRVLPGHGPVLDDALAVVEHYLRHRQQRLDAVRAAVAAGERSVDEVVARVYADVDRMLWPAARLSVAAQLEYLGVR